MITITPVYDDADNTECSSKAVLTTVFREKRRSTAFVLAKDLSTNEVLRCDVILDVIDKLDVLTTTRELYLEEAPETFELWAQDSQGKGKSFICKEHSSAGYYSFVTSNRLFQLKT